MGLQKTMTGAVLTGDIVNSTKLSAAEEEELIQALKRFLNDKARHTQFYRGDSFQAYLDRPEDALELALQCRAAAISQPEEKEGESKPVESDIRISIGIGDVVLPIGNLGEAKGEAFIRSGRRFDELQQQSEHRLAISSGEPTADIGFEVMADYLDSIYRGMTVKQAKVIVELLGNTTQQQLAVTLNKSKSTISQLANDGGWPKIERVLQQYKQLINQVL
jgi:hypothetical protein